MSFNRDFRVLLVQIAEKLEDHNIESIMAIEDLPRRLKGQSGLQILLQLENEEKISASNTTSLEELLKDIERHDLAKKVSKSRKKGKKTKKTADHKEMHQSLEAHLEVTMAQMKILIEELAHLKEKIEQNGIKSAEDAILIATTVAENVVEAQLVEVKRIIKTRSIDSSGSEDSLPVVQLSENYSSMSAALQKGYLPKKIAASPPSSVLCPQTLSTLNEDEDLYTEIHHHLIPQPVAAATNTQAQSTHYENLPKFGTEKHSVMVTGASEVKTPPQKPAPPPKPKNYKKKSREPVYEDTDDFTGGSGGTTGGTTGDSGFSDPKEFLRSSSPPPPSASSLPPPPPHHKYTPINREEVGISSYYKSTRDTCDKFQEVMKSGPKETERIYQNINNYAAPHNNT